VNIFTNQTIDGVSESLHHNGGDIAIFIWGAFGGGSVSIEVLTPDGSAWIPILDDVWTEASVKVVNIPPSRFRLSLSGSTGASVMAELSGY